MSKYNAKKVDYDGYTFDSEMEMEFYKHLKKAQKDDKVDFIEVHPKFEIQPKFELMGRKIKAITYEADFKITYPDGSDEVIDIKGFETADFKLKKKMFEYKYRVPLVCIKEAPKYVQEQTGERWIELSALKPFQKERRERLKREKAEKEGKKK